MNPKSLSNIKSLKNYIYNNIIKIREEIFIFRKILFDRGIKFQRLWTFDIDVYFEKYRYVEDDYCDIYQSLISSEQIFIRIFIRIKSYLI